MVWYAWALIAVCVLNVVVAISYVGKVRPVITPGVAIASLVVNTLEVLAIIALATH
jgi:hypothetical protein